MAVVIDLSKLILYGTAWKEGETERLTRLALESGFRGIDTANQRKHYYEAGVGRAIHSAIGDGLLEREDLFIQTKFTFQAGQDHRLPYDPSAPIKTQVQQSIASSLDHLQVAYLDALLLHGPSQRIGLGQADWDAWRAMESFHDQGILRSIGISNVSLPQLENLVEKARVRPGWVQNRCFAADGWDRSIRAYCRENAISYQGFSLLTANSKFLDRPALASVAARHRCSVPQIVFRFAMDVGILPLTGTTNTEHMRVDLDLFDFQLTDDEVREVESIAVSD
jgi:diketogulonate reductase-like aldo/keto reductase